MIKRKLLGQHFLNSKSIAEFIVKEAEISKNDIVFDPNDQKNNVLYKFRFDFYHGI